ncbi:MAG: DNA alkylation repair protein [Bacilli bacterium]|jgi:3-methyladenine DNA glycosylase AlkD|nr:hypothetical protein [Acholeplasmataceae bacterium]
MILNRTKWLDEDKQAFLDFLKAKGNPHKVAWSQNILQTPSPVLAIATKEQVGICKEIMKGNYQSFLDLQIFDFYETIALFGMILSRMKSLAEFKHYFDVYLDQMNCWAHCDLLNFPLLREEKAYYLDLSEKFYTDKRVMVRRLSLFILFKCVNEKEFLPHIFNRIKSFQDEKEYYVIMMAGWLLCECIIKHKDETLAFMENNVINKKIQNKAIQKCRESNRFTKEEKDFLWKYKVK